MQTIQLIQPIMSIVLPVLGLIVTIIIFIFKRQYTRMQELNIEVQKKIDDLSISSKEGDVIQKAELEKQNARCMVEFEKLSKRVSFSQKKISEVDRRADSTAQELLYFKSETDKRFNDLQKTVVSKIDQTFVLVSDLNKKIENHLEQQHKLELDIVKIKAKVGDLQ